MNEQSMMGPFTILGEPVCQQRARVVSRGGRSWAYDPTKTERNGLAMELLAIRQGAKLAILGGEIQLWVSFFISPKKRGQKPDLSNFLKAFKEKLMQLLEQMERITQRMIEICKKGEKI
jgi:Holliday junction resolvase RusA-like endonuclease